MGEPSDKNVRAVERAIMILNSFDDEHPERGVTDIAGVVKLDKATTYRILTTMLNYGLIERSIDGQRYKLGVQLVNLGFRVTRRLDVRREAYPFITQLAQKVDEVVDLSIFDQMQVLVIEMVQCRHALTLASSVGQRLPAHCTASGKVLLAFLPEEQLIQYLSKPMVTFTNNTITNPDDLHKQLGIIRERGLAFDNEESELGLKAVGSPILDQMGKAVAVVSVLGPVRRITKNRIPEISSALKETTELISRRFGWSK
jgi:DNA-binding IclR family transcriptional regulator